MPAKRKSWSPQRRHAMDNYLVVLRDNSTDDAPKSRADLSAEGYAQTAAFIHKLTDLLKARQMEDQYRLINQGTLGLSCTCTAQVAAIIKDMPEVDAISKDHGMDLSR